MKLKKGDKLKLIGFEKDEAKKLSKVIFETAGGNIVEFSADGDEGMYHFISTRTHDKKKFDEELEIP